MSNRTDAVNRYLDGLEHPRRHLVVCLRDAILDASPDIQERIKWNAPSFGYAGNDRVTFRLRPRDQVQLIFHRGVAPRDATGFTFADSTGLLQWAAPDRAVLTFPEHDDLTDRTDEIVALVNRWMIETRA